MVQRKKEGVRDAILEAAFRLFSEQGYNDTSIPAIAREAGMSTANVYVYFASKIEILYTLYTPWLEERLDKLERSLRRITDPRERLQRLLLALWRDLPRESNGFANNVMQAVSTSSGNGDYDPKLREVFQGRVAGWIRECLAVTPRESEQLAAVVLMAFDGFAMNVHLMNGLACNAETARLFSELLDAPRAPARRTQH
jgi:AcrR family transcriptional regulator